MKKSDLIFFSDREKYSPYQFLTAKIQSVEFALGFTIVLIELYQMTYVIYTK